jgi:type I restriction enzyme S subunit
MKLGWELKDFEECIDKIPRTTKIPKKQFLAEGKYPIVSQEDSYINGYWDKSEDLLKVDRPLVIFGDHTKKLKYIDFDFALGADGVKVLLPIKTIDARFFYYQLLSITLGDLGYARHYRLLKQEKIVIPPLEEQKRIVAKLDQCFEAIDKAKANASKNLKNAKELFQSKLNEIFSQKCEGWVEKKLIDICERIFAGGDKPEKVSKFKTSELNIPIFSNGEKNKGLYGYTDNARVDKPSVTISGRGTIGYSEIREEPFVPIVRLITLIPNSEIININFLHYGIQNIDFINSGSSIPQLTVPMVKSYSISITPLEEQKQIVKILDSLKDHTQSLESKYQQELNFLEELKKSILQKAFEGEL